MFIECFGRVIELDDEGQTVESLDGEKLTPEELSRFDYLEDAAIIGGYFRFEGGVYHLSDFAPNSSLHGPFLAPVLAFQSLGKAHGVVLESTDADDVYVMRRYRIEG